jgi:hypothetical protein
VETEYSGRNRNHWHHALAVELHVTVVGTDDEAQLAAGADQMAMLVYYKGFITFHFSTGWLP